MLVMFSIAAAGPARAALKTSAKLPVQMLAPGDQLWLQLSMTNRTRDTLYFPDFPGDGCWMDKYADLVFDPPRQVVVPAMGCKAEAVKVLPGDHFRRKVNLTSLYALPAETIHTIQISWKGGGADVYTPLTALVGPVHYKSPFHTGQLKPGDTVFLPDKSSLEFVKFVPQKKLERGDQPMLELEMIHKVPGEGEFPQTFSFPYEETQQFLFKSYVFHVPNHQYGQFLEIRVFE